MVCKLTRLRGVVSWHIVVFFDDFDGNILVRRWRRRTRVGIRIDTLCFVFEVDWTNITFKAHLLITIRRKPQGSDAETELVLEMSKCNSYR